MFHRGDSIPPHLGPCRKTYVLLLLLACSLAAIMLLSASFVVAQDKASRALVLSIEGAIGPALTDYVAAGMQEATAAGDIELLILQLDTPGGLDRAMRDIIQMILNSPLPVVSYVAPEGARAASAGTYILYASHVAAMSPATNLGAATPVSIGGLPGSADPPEEKENQDGKKPDQPKGSAMERKVINDSAAYIRSLAERHGRNAEWAEQAVREAVSLSAAEALDKRVIDIVAVNLPDLLAQLDGRQVRLASGTQVLSTGQMSISRLEPSWKQQLLMVITDPNIAYLLLLLGFYGLIFELANPGMFLPGVVGGIALLLALYAFQLLPINYAGLALMVLGLVLMISEIFVPSFGSLGVGGLVAFVAGSVILFDDADFRIAIPLIAGTAGITAVFILVLIGRFMGIRKKEIRTGEEALIGMTGEAAEDFLGAGKIWLRGELWQAEGPPSIRKGQKVKVISRKGLYLTVERITEEH